MNSNSSAVEFIPVSEAQQSDPKLGVSGDSEWVALGPASCQQVILNDAELLQKLTSIGSCKASVIPFGEEGHLRWNRLERQAAVTVAFPTQDAVVVLKRSVLSDKTTLWQSLISLSEPDVRIEESAIDGVVSSGFLKLIPVDRHVPSWLRTEIDKRVSIKSSNSKTDLTALLAGLYQVHDALDQSHRYSQSIEGKGDYHNGDYWHAIMHRREGDFSNSKYWFRHVGSHPIESELVNHASQLFSECDDPQAARWGEMLTESGWNARAFVDLCQQCSKNEDSTLAITARRLQWREMLLLLDFCWQQTFDL